MNCLTTTLVRSRQPPTMISKEESRPSSGELSGTQLLMSTDRQVTRRGIEIEGKRDIQEVHQVLVAKGRIDQRIQSLSEPQTITTKKSTSSRVRRCQGQIGEHPTLGNSRPEIHSVIKEITRDIHVMAETRYPDCLRQHLDDATPKDVPMVPIVLIRAENPLAIPNLLMLAEDQVESEFYEQLEIETQMEDQNVANIPSTN